MYYFLIAAIVEQEFHEMKLISYPHSRDFQLLKISCAG